MKKLSLPPRGGKDRRKETVASALLLATAASFFAASTVDNGLYSLWRASISTPSNNLNTATVQFQQQAGSGTASGWKSMPGTVSSSFEAGILTTLLNNNTVATVTTLSFAQDPGLKATYSLSTPTMTGIFAEDATTAKVFTVASPAACTPSATGTLLYDGVLNKLSVAQQTLPAVTTKTTTTAPTNVYLCSVISIPPPTTPYEQTATISGDTDLGPVTATSTWNATVQGTRTGTGTLAYNTTWGYQR